MTLPDECARSLLYTRNFLRALLDPKQTPRVPKAVRRWAYSCLKHYPWSMEIKEIASKLPNIFGTLPEDEL